MILLFIRRITEGEYTTVICNAEILVGIKNQMNNLSYLILDLLRCYEQMRIILAEVSATLDTFQSTTGFITEIMCDLTDTDRKILVRMSLVCINHHVVRAVHRTKYEGFTFHFHWGEHVLFVMIPVTGGLVQINSTNTRSHNVQITKLSLLILNVVLKFLPDCISLRKEHRKSTAYQIIYHEQVHILTNLTMVSFLCFLQKLQMCFQFFRSREAYTIDSLKHLVLAVTLPVCT